MKSIDTAFYFGHSGSGENWHGLKIGNVKIVKTSGIFIYFPSVADPLMWEV